MKDFEISNLLIMIGGRSEFPVFLFNSDTKKVCENFGSLFFAFTIISFIIFDV